jgi:tetratricopeptide (TPR) repeat protein
MKRVAILIIFFLSATFSYSQNFFEEGLKQYYLHNEELAIELFSKAISNNQEIAKSFMMRGATKIHQGYYIQARTDLNISISIDSNLYKSFQYIGRSYFFESQPDSAILYFKQAIKLNMTDPDLYDDKAMAEVLRGNFYQAILDEDIAIKLNQNDENYYVTRGYAKLQLNNIEAAESGCLF